MTITSKFGWAAALLVCAERWVDGQDAKRRDVMLWEMVNMKVCLSRL